MHSTTRFKNPPLLNSQGVGTGPAAWAAQQVADNLKFAAAMQVDTREIL